MTERESLRKKRRHGSSSWRKSCGGGPMRRVSSSCSCSSSKARLSSIRIGAGARSVRRLAAPVEALLEAAEKVAHLRVPHRLAAVVGQKVLLRHIGDVLGLGVLGEEVIERLVLGGP